jgi:hypothetical protein
MTVHGLPDDRHGQQQRGHLPHGDRRAEHKAIYGTPLSEYVVAGYSSSVTSSYPIYIWENSTVPVLRACGTHTLRRAGKQYQERDPQR